MDPKKRWLVAGKSRVVVTFHDLNDSGYEPTCKIFISQGRVRQLSFCTDGRILVAVGDGGLLARFDRVQNNVPHTRQLSSNCGID
uniref:Uncharacterized protein n=1 Tax=Caenorhabditis japonica TaxID=281687 RepID=A0A8R1E8S3_CAEJA